MTDCLNVAYLIPEGQYEFFGRLVNPLLEHGVACTVNRDLETADVILAGILPTDHRWMDKLTRMRYSSAPSPKLVVWHWDFYSFTDYGEDRWRRFLDLLPQADRIWSCTYEVARQLKEVMNLDSVVVPAWVDGGEFGGDLAGEGEVRDEVLYAASGCGFGKRIEWMERACKLLGLPARVLRGQGLDRRAYVDAVRRCRVYCMTAFEESNATIPAMEAAVAGRPVVVTDLPSSREVFGESMPVLYFAPNDFKGLLVALGQAWHDYAPAQAQPRSRRLSARQRVLDGYGLPVVAKLAARNLWEVYRDGRA